MAAGHREQVSVCARLEDKEACEEGGGGDERVSLSFVIPSDSHSIIRV